MKSAKENSHPGKMAALLQSVGAAPMQVLMLESLALMYGVSVVAGSWLMLKGVAEAPLGYEDEDGFHYLSADDAKGNSRASR